MAATLQHNITTILTKNLLEAGDKVNDIKSITLANVDSSNDAEVDLFLNRGDDNFYILRIKVDNGSGAATAVDVIIKN